MRVIAYVDGYNLYYGLRHKRWKRFYWLNIRRLAQTMLRPNQTLVATRYFTTRVPHPASKRRRQQTYLEALGTLPDFEIQYGHFLPGTHSCPHCGKPHQTHFEKMTDVNIAVALLTDAYQDKFDLALLISADSDLVGPVRAVRELFRGKFVIVAFPPKRFSVALKQAANAQLHIGHNELAKSLFPAEIVKPDGFVLRRPIEWQ